MLNTLLARFSRVDERPVEQIDRDIDDELATHLFLLKEDLLESGLSPAAARETALSRFGNPDKHKRHCRDVALKERRMKMTLQVIIPTVCGLVMGAVLTSVWFNQQSANAALVNMSDKMEELSRSLSARTPAQPPSSQMISYSNVYITGTPVVRPGQYAVPSDGLTLRRLLATAGVNAKYVAGIDVRHSSKYGEPGSEHLTAAALQDSGGPDIELRNDDLVTVVEGKP